MLGGIIGAAGIAGCTGPVMALSAADGLGACGESVVLLATDDAAAAVAGGGNASTDDVVMLAAAAAALRSTCRRLASAIASVQHITNNRHQPR